MDIDSHRHPAEHERLAEQHALAVACQYGPAALSADGLQSEHFGSAEHRLLYRALVRSAAEDPDGLPDQIAVMRWLMEPTGGGLQEDVAGPLAGDIFGCHSAMPTHSKQYVADIIAGHNRRQMLRLSEEAIRIANGEQPGDLSAMAASIGALQDGFAPSEGWPEPVPIRQAPCVAPKPYSLEMLPASLRPWVADVHERARFHLDFLVTAALAALGITIGRQCAMFPKQMDDWHEFPNLWAVVVGRPGAMKSPALNKMLGPLRRIEGCWLDEHTMAMSEFHERKKRAEIEGKAVLKKAHKAAERGEEFTLPTAFTADEPTPRRLLTSDPTEAKLGELLASNPNGMVLELDELANLASMFEREPSLREFFLKAWDGKQSHVVDRIGRGTIRIPALCFSIIGGIQPSRIAPLVRAATDEAGGDGLLQRLQLVAYPYESTDPWVNVDRMPDNPASEMAFEVFDRLANATRVPSPISANGRTPGLRFSLEAQEVFNAWHTTLRGRMGGSEVSEAMESVLAKMPKTVAAVSLIHALADWPNDGVVGMGPLNAALAVAEAAESHTDRLYRSGRVAGTDAAKAIWRKICEGKLDDNFTARQVKQRDWRGLDAAAVDSGLETLCEAGWLVARKVNVGTAGRPSATFSINPLARRKFAADAT